MSIVEPNQFMPTMQFGFNLSQNNQHILHQLWVTASGLTEWRPVPMIELGKQRTPAIAGYLEDDEEDK